MSDKKNAQTKIVLLDWVMNALLIIMSFIGGGRVDRGVLCAYIPQEGGDTYVVRFSSI
jgi:hypothetical protein